MVVQLISGPTVWCLLHSTSTGEVIFLWRWRTLCLHKVKCVFTYINYCVVCWHCLNLLAKLKNTNKINCYGQGKYPRHLFLSKMLNELCNNTHYCCWWYFKVQINSQGIVRSTAKHQYQNHHLKTTALDTKVSSWIIVELNTTNQTQSSHFFKLRKSNGIRAMLMLSFM